MPSLTQYIRLVRPVALALLLLTVQYTSNNGETKKIYFLPPPSIPYLERRVELLSHNFLETLIV